MIYYYVNRRNSDVVGEKRTTISCLTLIAANGKINQVVMVSVA